MDSVSIVKMPDGTVISNASLSAEKAGWEALIAIATSDESPQGRMDAAERSIRLAREFAPPTLPPNILQKFIGNPRSHD